MQTNEEQFDEPRCYQCQAEPINDESTAFCSKACHEAWADAYEPKQTTNPKNRSIKDMRKRLREIAHAKRMERTRPSDRMRSDRDVGQQTR
ncbi:hypothetical protein BH23CHL2_BH23CHL2_09890 [soil metagenome]